MLRSSRIAPTLLALTFTAIAGFSLPTTTSVNAVEASYQVSLGANVIADPNYLLSCSPHGYDNSVGCTDAVLAAINNARALEGISAMILPTGYFGLSPTEQLFVVINLERVARGLAPATATTDQLNSAAQQGAVTNSDPQISNAAISWGANWAWGEPNVLAADYVWMYDDGFGSPNITCNAPSSSGCWGHRKNILVNFGSGATYAGFGYNLDSGQMNSISMILANSLASSNDHSSLSLNQLPPESQSVVTRSSPPSTTAPSAISNVVTVSELPVRGTNHGVTLTAKPTLIIQKAQAATPTGSYPQGSPGWMVERYSGVIALQLA